jgi:hypothetical protein
MFYIYFVVPLLLPLRSALQQAEISFITEGGKYSHPLSAIFKQNGHEIEKCEADKYLSEADEGSIGQTAKDLP